MKYRTSLLVGLFFILSFAFAPTQNLDAAGDEIPNRYIVLLEEDVDALQVANAMARAHGLGLGHVYGHAVKAFAANIPPGQLKTVADDPRVRSVTPDRYVSLANIETKKPCPTPPCNGGGGGGEAPPEQIPTGVSRIGGSVTGQVDVDVAIIDTGIMSKHADLNVVGGINCSTGKSNKYNDGHGHGTHVAGTVGALDNASGVIGVAPGARLWAVRVLNNNGSGTRSDVICGIDWVTANADQIEVANMSLGGAGSDDGLSCAQTVDPYKLAICNSVAAGVTYVVAAGNSAENAALHVPASYDMVLTVSALADFDGVPGGTGSATCRADIDDTFADFSNFGNDVDMIAPGVCILSTWNDGGYNTISGTSMASPHVAGAAALYLANNTGASPASVQSALQASGNFGWNNQDDPDGIQEPLLDVSGFALASASVDRVEFSDLLYLPALGR